MQGEDPEARCFRSWFYAVLLSVHRNRCRRAFWRRFLSLESDSARRVEPVVEAASDFAGSTKGKGWVTTTAG